MSMNYLGRSVTGLVGIALVVAIIAFLPTPAQILGLLLTLPLGAALLTHAPVSLARRRVGTPQRLMPSGPRLVRAIGYASGQDRDMTRR